MRKAIIAAALLTLGVQAAQAQTTSFRGFRVEGNIGWDKAQSEGRNNEKLGYGGSAGFDGQIGERIVVGPEVTYWRPNDGGNIVSGPVGTGFVRHRQGDAWGGAVRAGYLVTPSLLVFGKGGYVNEAQGRAFYGPTGAFRVGDKGHADGYQVGGGLEYTLHDRFSFAPTGVYVSAQYVYSNFDNHTADQHAMAGVGFRFK